MSIHSCSNSAVQSYTNVCLSTLATDSLEWCNKIRGSHFVISQTDYGLPYLMKQLILLLIRTPNPSWSPPPPPPLPSPSPSRFLHQLQTSITLSFIKLECFLRLFLNTRSHDESAHTFRSSLRFLEVPQKGV